MTGDIDRARIPHWFRPTNGMVNCDRAFGAPLQNPVAAISSSTDCSAICAELAASLSFNVLRT